MQRTDVMCRKIRKRKRARDVFITPRELGAMHITLTKQFGDGVWYDPFRHDKSGTYFSQFQGKKVWAEIEEDRDFFCFEPGKVDVICSNPPYSMMDKVLERSIQLKPSVISYLIGVNNLTTRRLEMMNKHGYTLVYCRMLKVNKWFGMSFICIWKEGPGTDVIQYDRKVWRED